MPEIDFFLFDLEHLLKLFSGSNNNLQQDVADYECETHKNMIQIRMNLFSEFGYKSDLDKVLT